MTPLSFLIPMFLTGIVYAAPTAPYVVETRIFVDSQVLSNYIYMYGYDRKVAESVMKKDIDVLLKQVNDYMKELQQYGLNVVVYADVVIQPEEVFFKEQNIYYRKLYNKLYLVFNQAWSRFQSWLLKDTKAYDVNILWTGHSMVYNHKSGKFNFFDTISWNGNVCHKGNSIGLVYYDATQRTARNTAFSIMKIISYNNCEILTTGRLDVNKCLGNAMKRDLRIATCLLTKSTPAKQIDNNLDSLYGSDIFDIKKVCQRTVSNAKHYAYKDVYKGDNHAQDPNKDKCQILYCSYDKNMYLPAHPTEGMICGQEKRCMKGECKTSPK